MFPEIAEAVPPLANLMTILPGLAGISLAANPDGAVAQAVAQVRAAIDRLRGHGPPKDSAATRALGLLAPPPAPMVPERIAIGASAAGVDRMTIDDETGLSWGRCHVDP